MRNKILVVESDLAAREQLENILQEIVEEGGELFFTDKREDALAIVKKERPAVVLLASNLMGESKATWIQEGVRVILTLPRGVSDSSGEESLSKPFRPNQVLEKCREYLNREAVPPIPPM